MSEKQKKAKAILAKQNMRELLDLWDMASRQKHNNASAILRCWIADEVKKREPERFRAWIYSTEKDKSLRNYILG